MKSEDEWEAIESVSKFKNMGFVLDGSECCRGVESGRKVNDRNLRLECARVLHEASLHLS